MAKEYLTFPKHQEFSAQGKTSQRSAPSAKTSGLGLITLMERAATTQQHQRGHPYKKRGRRLRNLRQLEGKTSGIINIREHSYKTCPRIRPPRRPEKSDLSFKKITRRILQESQSLKVPLVKSATSKPPNATVKPVNTTVPAGTVPIERSLSQAG